MSDRIQIKDLLLRTIIGINKEERRNRQDVLIDIVLYTDTRLAGISDSVDDTVNYRTITKRVIKLVEESQFYLVEKLAAEVAAVCLEDPRVERARVRVEKPGALRFARSVGVEIQRARAGAERASQYVFVALGSNMDSEHNMRRAVEMLAARLSVLAVSRVYETAPVGRTDQPRFLNAAVLVETNMPPQELKTQVLEDIERKLGRVRTGDKNAPRTIDLDIVLYGDQVLDIGQRHVPDPDILRYPHVAVPLADLAPQKRHPETSETLLHIAQDMPAAGLVLRRDLVLWPLFRDADI
jgi:dihydroneopterin aldolase/2-amino-4-hydroxy-6-hydroxymethyldihydropteridine diphosphokinase